MPLSWRIPWGLLIRRSSTGYLTQKEFSAVVAEFFGTPEESVRGWERAIDAQARIVTATTSILREAPSDDDVAIVAHGGVGTLLLCHLTNLPISQDRDQPATNGNYFAFDRPTLHLIHGCGYQAELSTVGLL